MDISALKVMLIDDQEPFDHMLKMLLRANGFGVIYVSDIENALEAIGQHPDVVMMDEHVCDRASEENCRQLRNLMKMYHMPVMMLCDNDSQAYRESMEKLGADDYLQKPFEPQELIAHLHQLLKNTQHVSLAIESQRYQHSLVTIRHVLEQDNMQLAFQVILGVNPRRILGVEVLARPMAHVPYNNPAVFFKEAVRCGMYQEVECYVWTKAMQQLKAYTKELFGKMIFLNCETIGLQPENWTKLKHILINSDVPAGQTCVDVNQQQIKQMEDDLQKSYGGVMGDGYLLALDDIGGGVVSFEHIIKSKPNFLKIDRQIIAGVAHDVIKRSIVKLLVRGCQQHGIKLIAEGVENVSDYQALVELGVDALQGYYIGKPHEDLMRCFKV